jgi:hypothetical protein
MPCPPRGLPAPASGVAFFLGGVLLVVGIVRPLRRG